MRTLFCISICGRYMPKIIECNFSEHGERIRSIYNKVVQESTATYDHTPYSTDYIKKWFDSRIEKGFPIIGAVTDDAEPQLMGFATYDYFRGHEGYSRTVEHSLYVHSDYQGNGLGLVLLKALVRAATEQRLHVIVGVIDSANHGSIHLHEKLGFEMVGTLRQAGHKFGQWLDVSFMQLILPGSETPPV